MQLLWALLNVVLLMTFLGLCMEADKPLRRSIGMVASVIFVLGLLSFTGRLINTDSKRDKIEKTGLGSSDSLNPASIRSFNVKLEENLIASTNLTIRYGESAKHQIVPFDAYSSQLGFATGAVWQPQSISVNTSSDGLEFDYAVAGVLKWYLLGATVYTQHKIYTNRRTERERPFME